MRVLTRARQRTADLGAQSVIEGDALDLASCIEAVSGCGSIICTIGDRRPPKDRPIIDGVGFIQIIDAAVEPQTRRFVLVSRLGVSETWNWMPFPVRWFFSCSGLRPILKVKEKRENHLMDSGLDWDRLTPG